MYITLDIEQIENKNVVVIKVQRGISRSYYIRQMIKETGEREKRVFKDRKEFRGSLLKQITEAFEYIDLLNKTRVTFEGLVRRDERDYPVEAIREALLNAVVHRKYSFGASTLINIYEDRMEFISLGGIVSGLSLEAVMLGISQSRNEKLANVFYRLETYGTGIQKILLNYEKYKMKPIFKTEIGVF